ncbi:transposase [Pseudaminobacter sp. NGMCC 1.201702]|uniref:transposase n=1 Tax=Pseudaminobacter sp. NGMCC 1.201702 TaxID=3391825 RepID=UPI0039EFAA00
MSDAKWALIGPLLLAEERRGCRPAQDKRRYFKGMMWMARTVAQWRNLPVPDPTNVRRSHQQQLHRPLWL